MPNNIQKKWLLRLFFIAGFIFTACNLFNPSGEGDLPDSAEGMLSVGQSRLQNQDWDGAMKAFAAAIKEDSTNSLAYYGYCKAVRFKWDLNGITLSKELEDTNSNSKIPFNDTNKYDIYSNYLKATHRLKPAMSKLAKRDSLTRWMKLHMDTEYYLSEKDNETGDNIGKAQKRRSFIRAYIDSANHGVYGYYDSVDFPLMDGVINYEKIMPDLTMVLLVHTFMNLKDINGDSTLDSKDNIKLVSDIMGALDSGNVEENLQNIMTSIFADTAAQAQNIDDFNKVLESFSEGSDDLSEVLGSVGALGISLGGSSDSSDTSASSGDQLTSDIQATMDSIGDKSKWYRFSDNVDNDGDGCVDEEVYDGKDNDGDGIVDEDLRVTIIWGLPITLPPSTDSTWVSRTSFAATDFTSNMLIKADSAGGTALLRDSTGLYNFIGVKTSFWKSDTGVVSIADAARFKIMDAQKGKKPPYNLDPALLNEAKSNIKGCWQAFY